MNNDFECRICASREWHGSFRIREMMFGTRTEFDYDHCGGCGGLQIRNIPPDLGVFYPEGYYSFARSSEQLSTKRRIVLALRRLQRRTRGTSLAPVANVIQRRFGPLDEPALLPDQTVAATARILDVGCGDGRLLRDLRDAGYGNLRGVDPFVPASLTFAGGVHVTKAEISALTGTFDLVMLHHVFEHLVDPRATLRDILRLLAPGGQILLRFPSVPCEAFDVYGTDWVQLDVPRHLHIVSRAGLTTLASEVGLRLTSWTQDSGPLQFWGSEQYQRDIPLFDARSYARDSSVIETKEYADMERRAAALNVAGRGDQSVAVLCRADSRRGP